MCSSRRTSFHYDTHMPHTGLLCTAHHGSGQLYRLHSAFEGQIWPLHGVPCSGHSTPLGSVSACWQDIVALGRTFLNMSACVRHRCTLRTDPHSELPHSLLFDRSAGILRIEKIQEHCISTFRYNNDWENLECCSVVVKRFNQHFRQHKDTWYSYLFKTK